MTKLSACRGNTSIILTDGSAYLRMTTDGYFFDHENRMLGHHPELKDAISGLFKKAEEGEEDHKKAA